MSENSDRTIREWTDIFSELYSEADSKRTPEQIWIAVMAHSSSIGESIRKVAFRELLRSAAHTFCWLCSFANKCNGLNSGIFSFTESLCEMISLKYPNKCGHCRTNPCSCSPIKMDAMPNKAARYEELMELRRRFIAAARPYTIADWKNMFSEIYSEQVHILSLESIGFHFLEEVGEGAVQVRKLSQLRSIVDVGIKGIDIDFLNELATVEGIFQKYIEYCKPNGEPGMTSKDPDVLKARLADAKMELVVEIGDTFSWFCAILNKLESISKSSRFSLQSLEAELNDVYFGKAKTARCPTCKRNPCRCVFYP